MEQHEREGEEQRGVHRTGEGRESSLVNPTLERDRGARRVRPSDQAEQPADQSRQHEDHDGIHAIDDKRGGPAAVTAHIDHPIEAGAEH